MAVLPLAWPSRMQKERLAAATQAKAALPEQTLLLMQGARNAYSNSSMWWLSPVLWLLP